MQIFQLTPGSNRIPLSNIVKNTENWLNNLSRNKLLLLTLKMLWGQLNSPHPPMVFPKMHLLGRQWRHVFLWLLTHVFPENFIQIPQVIQKILKISLSIVTILIIIFFEKKYSQKAQPFMVKLNKTWPDTLNFPKCFYQNKFSHDTSNCLSIILMFIVYSCDWTI